MSNSRGVTIGTAVEVIRKTYKDIERLIDDAEDLLSDYDSSLKFNENFSFGGKNLHLRANHTYLARESKEDEDTWENDDLVEQHVLAFIIIFFEEWDVDRVSLSDQPEIWIGLFTIKNLREKCRSWHIRDLLKKDEKQYFTNGEPRIGGDIFEYYWIDSETKGKNREEFKGQFVGYALTDIADIHDLKTKIMEKLFKKRSR